MGSGEIAASSSQNMDMSIAGVHERHQRELENLTLVTQPFKTFKFFILAMLHYFWQSVLYLLSKGGWLLLLSAVASTVGFLLVAIDGPHEKHLEELSHYMQFGLWWIALGVASSIGLETEATWFQDVNTRSVCILSSWVFILLSICTTALSIINSSRIGGLTGTGLHTFVLYLGPHIALFTIKAMQCGRVDLKSAPYDTIQINRSPSWLDKGCHEFGEPMFPLSHGLRVPLGSILPQVQLEAVLWGFGTVIGELPPYFISRAARLSGSKVDAMEELDTSSGEDSGFIATHLTTIKHWLWTHSQHLNFFTILALASVPNPLFDLAGIMCGQFGIPFWKFFLATLIGKAIIKTHIQTLFIISVCNNQLLNWLENEMIWMFSFTPGLASVLPGLIAELHALREKYMAPETPVPLDPEAKQWNFSFATIWNTVVWLMLLNFFFKIINATAQRYWKKEQEKELAALTNNE